MLVVYLWEEAVTPSPVYRVPRLGPPPDQEAVEENWKGLSVGASEGAVG